ncbi:MAG: hypothetical protein M9958_06490 [Chitinophagales bacterium]|nr:hypothetical protein [Chitinophagales bacterium]
MKDVIQGIFSDKRAHVSYPALAIGVVLIILTGWYFTKDLSQSLDLLFWDEANYMKSGMLMPGKFNHSWGPSYAIWYKFLSLFEKDTIELYFLNYRWMTILPAAVFFIFLVLSNVRFWTSLGVCLLFLFTDINLPVWPKISHYCISIFLIGLILVKYINAPLIKVAVISLFALNISYARPEFYLSYLVILALWVLALCVKSFRSKNAIISSLVLLGIGVLIQLKMGNPLFNFNGDRSALAFAQHFMFNYFQWKHIDQDFWITWMTYYQDLFHNASSIKEAYQINPTLFQLHFLTNIQNYFSNALLLFSDAMLPQQLIHLSLVWRLMILAIGGVLMLLFVSQDKYLENILNGFKRNILVLILLTVMVGPTLISSIVIYPRMHYMLFHFFLLSFIISILVFSKPKDVAAIDKKSVILSFIIVCIIWVLMPSTKSYHHFDMWRKETSQANLNTVKKLRAYNFTTPIRLLENEGGMNLFLPNNYIWIRGFAKDTTWTAYIEREHVDIIYVTPSLTKYPTLKSDSTWYDFKARPEQYGFEKVITGNHVPYLYIRKNLLGK